MIISPLPAAHILRLARASRRSLPDGRLSHFLWEEKTPARSVWSIEICYTDSSCTQSIRLADIASDAATARSFFDLLVRCAVTPLGAEDAYHEWLTP